MHKPIKSQEEITALFKQDLVTGVGKSVKHDSAPKHVSSEGGHRLAARVQGG